MNRYSGVINNFSWKIFIYQVDFVMMATNLLYMLIAIYAHFIIFRYSFFFYFQFHVGILDMYYFYTTIIFHFYFYFSLSFCTQGYWKFSLATINCSIQCIFFNGRRNSALLNFSDSNFHQAIYKYYLLCSTICKHGTVWIVF